MALGSLQSLGLDLSAEAGNISSNALKAYIHALLPNEFEYYLFSLELVTPSGELIDSLIFPVMPHAISEQRPSLVNVKKTNSSIISITNRTFAPTTISVSGTFGRKLRLLFSSQDKTKENSGSAFTFSKTTKKNKQINGELKTGYGITKMLERIIIRSQREEGNLLFLYNLALNNNYLVECTDMSLSQSSENNMLWNYQLTFKSLSRAEDIYPGGDEADRKKINSLMKFGSINAATAGLMRVAQGIESFRNEAAIKMGVNPDYL